MQQHQALDLLKMGKNIFLTGAAGSGKTYVLNQYIEHLKAHNVNVAITASTGIAATHLEGMTIHAWSGIGIKGHLTQKDLEKIQDTDRIKRNYKKTKVLIIDEISMLHKNQLDMVDAIARCMLDKRKPFGGLQVVLCGDFFQLPPVTKGAKTQESPFAFESIAWRNSDFQTCYLHEQHRQGDDPLIEVLNDIRNGKAGEHTKIPLRTRYKKEPEGGAKPTRLYSRNINVDSINDRELSALKGEIKTFSMTSEGAKNKVESLKKSTLALAELKLKVGAQVMFVKNDVQGRYVNGTRGVIVSFDKKDGWPVVKTHTSEIIVASPEDWKYEENGIIRAIVSQVPLRLAWAITIHKSQGMTLDAAEMDLGDAFEPGMGYVALSRVRRLNGLKLMNLNDMALTVHPKVLQQDQVLKNHSATVVKEFSALSENEKKDYQSKTLIERFAGSKQKTPIKKIKLTLKKQKTPTHLITLKLLQDKLSIEAIAKTRELIIGTIISHIEKLKGLKLIDESLMAHLKSTIPDDDFDHICDALENSEDGRLKSVYDQFSGKYSYDWIKIVRLCG